MKIRKQMRHIYDNLRSQTYRALSEGHDHQPFMLTGTGCILCKLLDRSDHPLAMLQMARQGGMILDWLPAERELYELIGEKAFKKRIEEDVEFVKNLPKLECRNCFGRTVLFMTLKDLAYITLKNAWTQYKYACEECGHTLMIKKEDIPAPLMEAMRRRLLVLQKKNRKKREVLVKKLKKKIEFHHMDDDEQHSPHPFSIDEILNNHTIHPHPSEPPDFMEP